MPKITKKINAAILAFTLVVMTVNIVFDYFQVKKILSETYDSFLLQMAHTAVSCFRIDNIERYAKDSKGEAYRNSLIELGNLTDNADISFLYVIIPDMPDCKYKSYVFNTVNSKMRNKYSPYPAGYREETYEESAARHKRLMTNGGMEYDYDYFSHSGARTRISMALKNSSGKIVGIICVEKKLDTISSVLRGYIRADILFAPILAALFLFLFGSFINKKFVLPLVLVTKEANGFASHDAHFSDKLKTIHSNDEIETLARSIDKMGIDIQIYIKDLMRVTGEKERISAELSVATGIQAGMLPKNFSPYADYPGIELYASMKPAKEVGGDFYDFFWTGKNRLWLVMGDVSGKGVPAAMFMVIAKALIRNAAMQDYEPSEVCARVNRQLCQENDQGLFVTCWIASVNLSSGLMKFSNAAHNPPALYDGETFKFLREKSGLMLGAIEQAEYEQHEMELKKGARLFIYTDGVTEAQNKAGGLFGEDLLLSALAKTAALSAKGAVDFINDEVERFENETEQSDDITTLVFYLDDFFTDSHKEEKRGELELDATDENLPKAMDFILGFLPKDAPADVVNKIQLAAEEIFVNISHYAYNDGRGSAKIVCSVSGGKRLSVTFMDSGQKFNPLEKEDPDLTLSAEEREIGGFGIYLVKKFMDKAEYRYENGMNVLTIEKTF